MSRRAGAGGVGASGGGSSPSPWRGRNGRFCGGKPRQPLPSRCGAGAETSTCRRRESQGCACKADTQTRLWVLTVAPRLGWGAAGKLGESKDRRGHRSLSLGEINSAAPASSPESGAAHLVWPRLCGREERLFFLRRPSFPTARERRLQAGPGSGSEPRSGQAPRRLRPEEPGPPGGQAEGGRAAERKG